MDKNFGKVIPEKVGISSQNILDLIEAVERKERFMHSFAIIHGDDIVAEGYWKPFDENKLHRMYSVSKSFVSIAVGLLCDEGKIGLHDKVVKYFPDKLPENVHPYIAEMEIHDLLRMHTCFDCGTTYKYTDPDWAWTFFNTKPGHPAGTVYNYDTSASYILDVIVERVTGKPFLEYMKDKALRKMGFSENARCVKAPEGNSWGGSGVLCTLRDLAKVAKLILDYGVWNGEQLLSRDYVETATSRLIDNDETGHPTATNLGYGYQIWQVYDGCFAFLGMGGQLAIGCREKNLVFVCNADTQNNSMGYHNIIIEFFENIVWKKSECELPENKAAYAELENRLSSLTYPHTEGALTSPWKEKINGRKYILSENRMGIKHITLNFNGDHGTLVYENAQGLKELEFGIGKYVETKFPQDGYYGDTIGKDGGKRYDCIASGAWTEDAKFRLKADIVDDYFGNVCMTFGFRDDRVGIKMSKCAEWFLNEYEGFADGKAE